MFRVSDTMFEGTGTAIDDASVATTPKTIARNQTVMAGVISHIENLQPVEPYTIQAKSVTVKAAFATPSTPVTMANGANQNVDVGDASFGRIAGPTGAFNFGGLTGGADGRILRLYNTSGQAMTINNDDAGSTAANRIYTNTGGNVVLAAGNSFATFIYDSAFSRWILTGTQP